MRTFISAFTSLLLLSSATAFATSPCPPTAPVPVSVTARTHGNVTGNNGTSLYWTYTDSTYLACGENYDAAYKRAEQVATRWSRDAHRDRLVQTAWNTNSKKDWLWGVATADWTWHTEYYVRNIDWSGAITHGCRSMRTGSSYCGQSIVNSEQLTWYPTGNAEQWNNPQGL